MMQFVDIELGGDTSGQVVVLAHLQVHIDSSLISSVEKKPLHFNLTKS